LSEILFEETALDKVLRLQNLLVARATGSASPDDGLAYRDLREYLAYEPTLRDKLPPFVKRCNDLGQFWAYIKSQSDNYQGRRTLIWDAFRPLVGYLEAGERSPGADVVSEALSALSAERVQAAWQTALDRRATDPEGAITAARTMLETVCKHILDDAGQVYPDDVDLPKLWRLTAERLNLTPDQHQETVFKAILGNCQSVVGNLAALRNKAGDAHGKGRRQVKPKPRHAELAVNLAGAMAAFLVETWVEARTP
jgi:hypothetical protein